MVNTRGYTYLITNGREYKIGITTKTPQSRVVELQTGSPTKITISGYSYNINALAMERKLHEKFASKRLEGEWFSLNDDDVAIIHHHFENNYLDEFLAPLSAKGVELTKVKMLEDLVKAEKQRLIKLEAAKRYEKNVEKQMVINLKIAERQKRTINRSKIEYKAKQYERREHGSLVKDRWKEFISQGERETGLKW